MNQLLAKINEAVPGAAIETSRLGRSQSPCVWIEAKSALKVAAFVKEDPELGLDWLENLSVMDLEGALVLTYFVRASRPELGGQTAVLRASLPAGNSAGIVEAISVREVWPMAAAQEEDSGRLFGIRFAPHPTPADGIFPMRKAYALKS